MADENGQAAKDAGLGTAKASGQGMKIALALSLAANLAVAGAVAGFLIAGRDGGPGPMVRDLGFGPFTAALSPEDRAALGRAFREQSPDLRAMRRDQRAELDQLVEALRTQPFDEAALRAAIAAQEVRGKARLELGQRLLADRLVAMSTAERAAFADRLEQIARRGHPPRGNGPEHGDGGRQGG